MNMDFIWAFITGLTGSLHCLGMCGPLMIAYSLQLRGIDQGSGVASVMPGITHHLTYHLGRIVTYGILGALGAGFLGLGIAGGSLATARNMAAFVAGLVMIICGVILLKVFRLPFTFPASPMPRGSVVSRFMGAHLTSAHRRPGWVLGLAAGLLPCMLSWAMVVKAASTQNPIQGFLIMVCFGAGTIPALLLVGFSASFFSLRMRLLGERAAALSIIAMGLVLTWKGMAPFV
ncbi:MAG TPA: sulfite exporter TauE/SafE family protein [Syntrophorhabdaceae bacterium]|jgi:hypothetical protein